MELDKIGKRIGNIQDLPAEIKKKLRVCQTDELERQIVHVIKETYEGYANVDEIIVGLYRTYNYITEDRMFLVNKLGRMMRSQKLEGINGRRGVYKILGLDLNKEKEIFNSEENKETSD